MLNTIESVIIVVLLFLIFFFLREKTSVEDKQLKERFEKNLNERDELEKLLEIENELKEKKSNTVEYFNDSLHRDIAVGIRQEVWYKYKGECSKCSNIEDILYDHIIPIPMGGTNNADNIELICGNCYRKKHDIPESEEQKA